MPHHLERDRALATADPLRGGRLERLTHDLAARPTPVLVLLVSAVVLPYAHDGFGFMLDDWFTLANATIDGWVASPGPEQWRARPAAALVYAVGFGLVGARPMVHWALLAVTLLGSALVLRSVLARRWGARPALLVTATWVSIPNHSSLEAWASTLNINLALLLLLAGVRLLDVPTSGRRRDLVGATLLALSTLSYEATAPAAILLVGYLAWERRRRHDPSWGRLAWAGCGGVAMASAWMVLNVHPAKQGLGVTIDPTMVIPGHFGTPVVGGSFLASVLPIVVLVGTAVVVSAAVRGRSMGWPEGAVVAGWGLIALGVLPFARYFYSPLGAGDRVTVVSGIGGALVLSGLAQLGFRRAAAPTLAFALVVLAGVAQQRATMVSAYTHAHRDSERLVAHATDRWTSPPSEPIVMGPTVLHHNAGALLEPAHILRYAFRTHDVRAELHHDRASFDAAAPGAGKVDLEQLFAEAP